MSDEEVIAQDPNTGSAGVQINGRWEMYIKLLSIALIPWAGWMSYVGMKVDAVEEDVAVIRGNHHSSDDQNEFLRAYNADMRLLWDALGERPTRAEVPPEWFENQVREIGVAVLRNSEKLDVLHDDVLSVKLRIKAP